MLTSQHCEGHPIAVKVGLAREYFHHSTRCLTEEDARWAPRPNMLCVAGHIIHVLMSLELFNAGVFGPYDGVGAYSHRVTGLLDMNWTKHAARDVFANEPDEELTSYYSEGLMEFVATSSLAKARDLFDQAMNDVARNFSSMPYEELVRKQVPENPLWPKGFTFYNVLDVMLDHTAHHRGILAMYARLLRKEPNIPYFDLRAAKQRAVAMAKGAPKLLAEATQGAPA